MTILVLLAGGYLIWTGLGFTRFCRVPPFPISVLFFLVFFGLVAWALAIGRRFRRL